MKGEISSKSIPKQRCTSYQIGKKNQKFQTEVYKKKKKFCSKCLKNNYNAKGRWVGSGKRHSSIDSSMHSLSVHKLLKDIYIYIPIEVGRYVLYFTAVLGAPGLYLCLSQIEPSVMIKVESDLEKNIHTYIPTGFSIHL